VNDPRGSIWRKWDLHVHTPFSHLNNGYTSNFEEYVKTLLQRAVENEVAAVGITDYFTIEGYKKLRSILDDAALLKSLCANNAVEHIQKILFIPNIEFRSNILVNDQRVNFHVIFSNELSPEQIEEDFLRELKFTVESGPNVSDEKHPLTFRNLESLGKRLKSQHISFQNKTDIEIGMMNAVIDHEDVSRILENKRSIFANRYLFAIPADEDLSKCHWDGQGHLMRKVMIQKSHIIFSSNASTRAFALGCRHPSVKEFVEEFKSLKPCVHGSDAHDEAHLFSPDEQRFTWINADPTFAGLKRILKEPDSRVFIGPEPPALLLQRNNTTRYCTMLSYEKDPKSTLEEHWFSGDVPLNTGLVAVIGNKGSGKSAMADSLGLLGNSTKESHFSFLHPDRFRNPRERKAEQFRASLRWLSENVDTRLLSDTTDPSSVETIKYIPQNYLEDVCNEVTGGEFDKELKSVIFSHVPDHERMKRESLDDLIAFKTDETNRHIALLRQKLHNLNERVISLDIKLASEYRQTLEHQLKHKQSELAAHIKTKPVQILPPDKDPLLEDENVKISTEIEHRRAEVVSIDKYFIEIKEKIKRTLHRKALAEKLKAKIENLQRIYNDFAESCTECTELGIKLNDFIIFNVQLEKIEEIISDAYLESKHLLKCLEDGEGTSAHTKKMHLAKIEELRKTMSIPQQRYQQYIEDLSKWEARHKEIEGAADILDSLVFFKAQIEELKGLPAELEFIKGERVAIVQNIFQQINSLARMYESLYSPIEKNIADEPLRDCGWGIGFKVSIVPEKFEVRLFSLIQQGRRGTFCGVEEGEERLRKMLRQSVFSTSQGVENFVASIEDALSFDLRDDGRQPVRISDIIRKGNDPIDVYDFLFGLDYLSPRYALTWGDRMIDQLSPGERGALLLVFYLLVDKNTMPLLIDQPEENLDNESIYRILVPCIKQAKERRQVIIVTHNPNLAVVCDADQVVYCKIDKAGGNRITYTTGAIENPVINQHIVDVLEGTRPAFDLRDAKYKLTSP